MPTEWRCKFNKLWSLRYANSSTDDLISNKNENRKRTNHFRFTQRSKIRLLRNTQQAWAITLRKLDIVKLSNQGHFLRSIQCVWSESYWKRCIVIFKRHQIKKLCHFLLYKDHLGCKTLTINILYQIYISLATYIHLI